MFKRAVKGTKNHVPFWYQGSLFAITFIVFMTMVFYINRTFRPKEHFYNVPELENYFSHGGIPVEVGLFLNHFSIFGMTQDTFRADLIIWFTYDPKLLEESDVRQFFFENGTILQKELLKTKHLEGGMVQSYYAVKLDFKGSLDYKNFPLDSHIISLILVNLHDQKKINLVSRNESFICAKKLFLGGWKLINTNVLESYVSETPLHNSYHYKRLIFTMDCRRSDLRHALSIIFPIFLIIFIILFCFSLNTNAWYDAEGEANTPHAQNIITLILFSVSTVITYRFVVGNISPNVDYYLFSDYLFYWLLGVTLLLFILILQHGNLTSTLKKFIVATIYISLISLIFLLT